MKSISYAEIKVQTKTRTEIDQSQRERRDAVHAGKKDILRRIVPVERLIMIRQNTTTH